ncbi:MAG: AMP-binding protein [Bacteroides sp.]|jgi:O-succinylbenzoic acid--CoA ligase|nr:AMP-binding protein [Bacteroides sp.]MCI1682259.1 AMP-binding protein [Bacteroides sp.]
MKTDRKHQMLILEGRTYSANEIYEITCQIRGGSGNLKDYSSCLERDPAYFVSHKDLFFFLEQWFDESPYVCVHTSGSTGKPKEQFVEKARMMQSARMTCEYLDLREGYTALLCMNLRYIGAMMMVVRALLTGMNLIVRTPSGHPFKDIKEPVHFVAMVPMQVYNTLQIAEECNKFKCVEKVLVGGGPVSPELERELRLFPNAVYSTYGMTETLSHIALRRLSGSSSSEHYYPFSSVHLSLTGDDTLQIDAPLVVEGILKTNDIARLYPDGSFVILGRKDNVINTGGVKVQVEQVEKKLSEFISVAFALTSVSDPKLGEKIVLLLESTDCVDQIKSDINSMLSLYERPKDILLVNILPMTGNGKIDRPACKRMAEQMTATLL